jgi:hypothetical protein
MKGAQINLDRKNLTEEQVCFYKRKTGQSPFTPDFEMPEAKSMLKGRLHQIGRAKKILLIKLFKNRQMNFTEVADHALFQSSPRSCWIRKRFLKFYRSIF